ncbi:P-loop containing nucleoside triphosphate hydrolase protein [Sordaria brevicollis]|uniref:Gluconokinase n=1 Tax=Sordaria brevicollis TaxID=83679 RepID=A0AAE0UA63_SORBR|nr:P-loop containing nucleoside triphosphate hydrolase protein [Sordaria brevicollis]
MLSYNTPISVNGQNAGPAGGMSARLPVKSLGNNGPVNGVSSNDAVSGTGRHVGKEQHIWLVTGPAGCGKSTVAKHLADALQWPYIEGDEYHPPANIAKMSAGIPLTDADRWDWLTQLREASIKALDQGNDGVVLTCSALKRKYRDVIRVAPYFTPNLHLHFIYLDASEEILLQRVLARQNHYMGANMVHSQFEALERPTPAETDVIPIDVSRPAEMVMADALNQVLRTIDAIQKDQSQ